MINFILCKSEMEATKFLKVKILTRKLVEKDDEKQEENGFPGSLLFPVPHLAYPKRQWIEQDYCIVNVFT